MLHKTFHLEGNISIQDLINQLL